MNAHGLPSMWVPVNVDTVSQYWRYSKQYKSFSLGITPKLRPGGEEVYPACVLQLRTGWFVVAFVGMEQHMWPLNTPVEGAGVVPDVEVGPFADLESAIACAELRRKF